MIRASVAIVTVIGTLSSALVPVRADPIADFYKGKSINFISSAPQGGGIATYAAVFAPYFSAHIPGNPRMIVQSMPGAGGLRAMQYFDTVAPKDGTTLGLVHSSVSFAPLYGIKGATFDPRKMNWIGSIDSAPALCVAWHTTGIRTWQDLFDKPYLVGTTGAGSQMETLPAMLNKLFGTKIKVISGYKGGGDIFIAMERGELSGRCGGGLVTSIRASRPDWFPQRKVFVPVQVTMTRSHDLPDVPAVGEFVKDDYTRRILQLILAPQEMDRPVLAPPGVPIERVNALRSAFHKAMNDPDFIAEMKSRNLAIEELSGKRVAEILEGAFALPAEIVRDARDAMSLANTR
jgi:tripartite-type tricarboxylate transporter receptor subunit TctC